MNRKTSFILAFAAVFVTFVFVWHAQRPVGQKKAAWQDVLAEARAGGYKLISTEELAGLYRKEGAELLLVDTRQEWEHRTGHIEGSLNFPMEPTWWARWRKADELEEFLGPDKDRAIVFY
jgi:hypothetical protein